jgi:transaldolase
MKPNHVLPGEPDTGAPRLTRLAELSALGQSVWIDFLSRDLIESGGLARAVEDDAVVGVTSNPSIFGKALSQGSSYDDQIESSIGDLVSVYHALAMRDVAAACDVMRPVWERTGGRDGYVSIEVDPNLAADTHGSIAQATQFHETIARPNLLVKIPATDAGVPAIEEMTARGYSINVTLIFSLERHRQVADAYLRGLERLIAVDGDPALVHSVASFFVSRVDSETDRRLAAHGRDDLRGQLRSPTPTSRTSSTRSCSPARAGRYWRPVVRPRSGASGPRPRRRTPVTATPSM